MNPNHKTTIIIFSIYLLSSLLSLLTNASPSPPVTALFAFGDSTVDSGNNNYIPTLFQANHRPYGQEYPGKVPTGRFSNGKLVTDFIASSLGLKPALPAYLDPTVKDVDLLTGVSFAAAGTGLDDQTAERAMVLTMDRQFEYFEEAVKRVKKLVGELETNRVISNALFVISVGTNDVVFNVYDSPTGNFHSVLEYHDHLLSKLQSFIQRLYKAGARRFVVAGLPPIGCLPFQVTLESFKPSSHMLQRVCTNHQNTESRLYNTKLQSLTLRLNQKLPGSRLVYLDIYTPILDMINYPAKYGFIETSRGCCGTGLMEMGPMCEFVNPTCSNASEFLFWDAVHLTQKAYSILAEIAKNSLLLI